MLVGVPFLRFVPTTLFILCIIANVSLYRCTVAASATNNPPDERYAKLVAWMKNHGGRVDSRFDVATMSNGVRGIMALSDIEVGAELLFCPWKLIIGSSGIDSQMQPGDGMCKAVEEMANEIRLGSESLWYPYLDHIELPRLVAFWDTFALNELQGLPPSQDATRHIQWYHQRCDGEFDGAAMRSLVAFVSRASEVGMVPIYDLLNHHNGKRNAKLRVTDQGVQLLVVGGPIAKDQEIYLSYGIKTASTMYRDYGFVEEWPTCWNFKTLDGDNYAFIRFPDGVVAISPEAELLKLVWQSNLSQEEYQDMARRHTESLPFEDLKSFANAGQIKLNGLPTTLEEDADMFLERMKEIEESSDSENAEDRVNAIGYRLAFKRALKDASEYAERALSLKSTKEQEL